jgi:hypothetical protein
MDKEALIRRLKDVAAANKLGLTSWPKKAGLSESIINNMIKSTGEQLLTLGTLQQLADHVGLTLSQLLDPNGPTTAAAAKDDAISLAEALSLFAEELRLMRSAQAEQTRILSSILQAVAPPEPQKRSM